MKAINHCKIGDVKEKKQKNKINKIKKRNKKLMIINVALRGRGICLLKVFDKGWVV
jgi:hypothetical protein